ncbi:MAG: GWxTD domain-containing protein [Candidatus Cloacimonetes bacterium]|nr:GWxTD domain-containing protein [Candidatus Cloacimonadota bacterium]
MPTAHFRSFVGFCLLWLVVAPLIAIDIMPEPVGDNLRLLILVPFDELHFEAATDSFGNHIQICHSELSVDVLDGRGRETFHTLHTIRFTMPPQMMPGSAAYPFEASVQLDKGYYTIYTSLFNKLSGAKTTRTLEVRVPRHGANAGTLWAICQRNGALFMSRTQWPWSAIDSVRFTQAFAPPPDSVMLYIEGLAAWPLQPDGDTWSTTLHPSGWQGQLDQAHSVAVYADKRLQTEFRMPSTLYLFQREYTPNEQVSQLRYILNSNDMRTFHQLDDDELQPAIDRFWDMIDPSPGTQQNEYRQAFYDRIITADERYSIKGGRQGWRTDMGRIFIIYGDPDEIVEEVHPFDSPAYIIWRYYEEMKEFIFYDFKGFGSYELRNKWQD